MGIVILSSCSKMPENTISYIIVEPEVTVVVEKYPDKCLEPLEEELSRYIRDNEYKYLSLENPDKIYSLANDCLDPWVYLDISFLIQKIQMNIERENYSDNERLWKEIKNLSW